MTNGHFFTVIVPGIFKSKVDHPLRTVPGHYSQTFRDIFFWGQIVLKACIKAFGILPDNDNINIVIAGFYACPAFGRPDIGIKLILLP